MLEFTGYSDLTTKEKPEKADYILSTSSEESVSLCVFDGETKVINSLHMMAAMKFTIR